MEWVNEGALTELLAFVADNPHAAFYKDKYARAKVAPTRDTFHQLPTLTRRELVETPVGERTYVAPEAVRFVAFTSGTSASVPLMVPFADIDNYYFEPSLYTDVRRPLVIHPPMMKTFGQTFLQQCRQAKHQLSPLFGDVQNFANSALLAQTFGCDSIYGIPTSVGLFAQEAAKRGIGAQFKLVALTSEMLTAARREELERSFPNALIANLYGSTELGQLPFFSCPTMARNRQNHFHILTDALAAVEIIDGQLVVSYALNHATPLVRYETGDYFEWVPEGCACGLPGPVVAWAYREGVDRVRLNGVEFDVEAADRALSQSAARGLSYQVHFYPVAGHAPRIEVELLDPSRVGATALEERVAAELLDQWKLSSSATLRTALEKGLFSSMSVKVVPSMSQPGLKAKRFVNHVV